MTAEKPTHFRGLERSTVPELDARIRAGVGITEEMLQAAVPKPIHVRVAEALGCQSVWRRPYPGQPTEEWCCQDGAHRDPNAHEPWLDDPSVARYDLDWAAAGPLVERFGIGLAPTHGDQWAAWPLSSGINSSAAVDASTALLAVCDLVLALHAAGKLREGA